MNGFSNFQRLIFAMAEGKEEKQEGESQWVKLIRYVDVHVKYSSHHFRQRAGGESRKQQHNAQRLPP